MSQAEQAFTSQQYKTALSLYQAIDSSLNNFSVNYNIGVCYYKLEQWEKAVSVFSKLLKTNPESEIVEYNLALSEYKIGHLKSAQTRFEWLYETAESDELALLAIKKYQEINTALGYNPKQITKNRDVKHWRFNAALGFGTDNNVISIVEDIPTTESDTFTELSLNPSWTSSSDINNSWIIDGLYFQSKYSDQSEYNIDVTAIGVRKYTQLNSSNRLFASLRLDKSTVGGDDYLSSTHLSLGGRYKNQNGFTVRYGLHRKSSDEGSDIYEPYAGTTQRYYLNLYKNINKHRFGIGFNIIDDNRNNSIGDTLEREDTRIYSADRQTLNFDYQYFANSWSMKAFYTIRSSDFTNENIYFSDGFDLPERITRKGTRKTLGILLSKDINKHVFLDAELRQTDNESNIENFSFDQQLLSVTLGFSF